LEYIPVIQIRELRGVNERSQDRVVKKRIVQAIFFIFLFSD